MTLRIELNTIGAVTALDKIAEVSKVSAMEAMSKAGSRVQRAGRAKLKRSKTNFWQIYRNGRGKKKGKLVRHIVKGDPHRFGNRISHGFRNAPGSLEDPNSMANFITSYLNEKAMVLVVAGKHKAFNPLKIRDGKIQGRMGKVNAVSAASHGILEKLETGETNRFSSNKLFKNRFKGRHFMQNAIASQRGYINNMMGETLAKMIQKQINKVEARVA